MQAPHNSVFYRPDALPAAQPTASKHWYSLTWIIPDKGPLNRCVRVGARVRARANGCIILLYTEALSNGMNDRLRAGI